LIDQFSALIENVRKWASKRTKAGGAKFDLYKNEILVGENTVFFKMGDKRIVFLSHNITDTLASSNEAFCAQTERFLNNLINQAPLLSGSSAKERDRFFNQMIEKIQALREKITRNDS
jgi:lipid A disaccharide synthetase